MTDRAALVVDGVIQVLYEVSTDALTQGETYTADYIATLEDIDQDNAAVGYRWNGTEYAAPIFADEGLSIEPAISEQIIEIAAETARDIAQQTIADEAATRDRLDQSLQAEIDAVEVSVAAIEARTITAGAGLTGGGTLAASRTINVGAGTGITVNADDVALTIPVAVSSGGTGQTTEAEAIGELTQALTADTTPDPAADYLAAYDASDDTGKKILINDLITAAEAQIESVIDTLPNLTSIQSLTVTLADAGADAVLGWDDSAAAYENLTAAEVRAAAGLGTIATQDANNVSITGGSVTGITDLAVADGGTGLSSTTAYAVLCGGTTSTGALQSIASVGTSGQVLTSNGAGALPTFQAASSGGMVLLNSGSVSSAATLDIVLTSYTSYRAIVIFLDSFLPVTNGAFLWTRFSTDGGSSYDSGASNYRYVCWGMREASTALTFTTAADTKILWQGGTEGVGNASDEGLSGMFILSAQASTAFKTKIQGDGCYMDTNGTPRIHRFSGAGDRETAQDTDAIRFLFSTGNIASGNWAIYGLS